MMNEQRSDASPTTQPPGSALERHVLTTVGERGLVRHGDHGLVCVSGGADSMALLHLLHALQNRLDLRLEVVHFDHGLREASGRDAEWVAARSGALGLPTHIVHTSHLAELKSGIPAAARAWRQQEARRLQRQWEANWIATGHQRDDTLETWLLKWLRGAHLTGLQGMAWRGGDFIRPLLDLPRDTLEAYLRGRGTAWLEDPSNRDPRFKRNRIRHELLPLLNDLSGGGIGEHMEDLEAQSQRLNEWLAASLQSTPILQSDPSHPPHWIDIDGLLGQPPFLREAALYRFVMARSPGHLPERRVREALQMLEKRKDGWSLDWPRKRRIRRLGERLLLETQVSHPHGTDPSASEGTHPEATVSGRVTTRVGRHAIDHPSAYRLFEGTGEENGPGMILHGLSCNAALWVRMPRDGDRFHPPWRPRPVKLRGFLRDQGLSRREREETPLLLLGETVIGIYPRHISLGHARPFEELPEKNRPGSDQKDGRGKKNAGNLNPLLHLVIERA